MQELNEWQKTVLRGWIARNQEHIGINFKITDETFSYDLLEQLRECNDYETLVQDIERFIVDTVMTEY